jgi:hypothetical protein
VKAGLLARAHEALDQRRASEDGYSQMYRNRNRSDVASRVAFMLECEPEDLGEMVAVAGSDESFLWRFTVEGMKFVAGTVWVKHPGPPGRRLYLGLVRSPIRGKYQWPPDVEHDDRCKLAGTTRISCLADLAEVEERR